MKILIMSDSHGHDTNVKKTIEKERPLDALFHLGDSQGSEEKIRQLAECPVHMVAGNCDFFTDLPTIAIVKYGKNRFFLTHGHYHYVSVGTMDLLSAAKENGCNVAIFGHTHRPVMDGTDGNVLILNPGSISLPRQEDRKASYMVIETNEKEEIHVRLSYV